MKKSQAAAAGKKEGSKRYTVKDFVGSKYGLPLLEEIGRGEDWRGKSAPPSESEKLEFMGRLADLYISWIESSPLKGKRRGRSYFILKAVESAVKGKKAPLPQAATGPTQDTEDPHLDPGTLASSYDKELSSDLFQSDAPEERRGRDALYEDLEGFSLPEDG